MFDIVAPTIRAIEPSRARVVFGVVGIDLDAQGRLDRVQELPLGGADPRRPPIVTDPGDSLGEAGDRVVVVAHRAVTGGARRDQVQPGDALLCRLDQVEAALVDGEGEAADLTDRLAAVGDQFRVGVGEPGRTRAGRRPPRRR